MPALTTCVGCGRPIPRAAACPECGRRAPAPKTATATERGYGADHRRTRRLLLPFEIGTPCGWCGELMLEGQALDLDHEHGPGVPATRMLHSRCNRSRGDGAPPRRDVAIYLEVDLTRLTGELHKARQQRESEN